jgi:SMI1 / KNR4 family (SUKH-1)
MTDDELISEARRRLPRDAPPPATADELAEAERQLGFPLPRLLQRMYAEVANGGWGPEYGANGLIGGHRADLDEGLVGWYRTMRDAGPDDEDPAWPGWPDRVVAVCHWGCAIWSCVDCSTAEGRVIRFDPNEFGPGGESWAGAWTVERERLAGFLRDWLTGELPFMPDARYPTCPTPMSFTAGWQP